MVKSVRPWRVFSRCTTLVKARGQLRLLESLDRRKRRGGVVGVGVGTRRRGRGGGGGGGGRV